MKVYYSNMAKCVGLEKYLPPHIPQINVLESFYGLKKIAPLPYWKDLFLDSGAFSAFRRNETLQLRQYIDFIKKHGSLIHVYAGMDVIGDPQRSWRNQKRMEAYNLSPLPTFHYGESWDWLKRYLDEYTYIALGGIVPLIKSSNKNSRKFMDAFWSKVMKHQPTCSVHGFGLNDVGLISDYPWFSVDASSAHVLARYGGVFTPWGALKINANVHIKYKSVTIHNKKALESIQEWMSKFNFPFTIHDAREPTTECSLMRAAISVCFYEDVCANKEIKTKKYNTGFSL